MKKILLAVTVTAIILSSCVKSPDEYRKEEVRGVTVHINPEIPSDPSAELDLRFLFSIKSENQTDTAAYFKNPVSLTEGRDGSLYVLDVTAMNVKKFDRDGNFVRTIGRPGQGPGELFYPTFLYINNDTLNVMSSGAGRLSKYSLDGNHLYDKTINQNVQLQMTKVSRDNKRIASYAVRQIQKEGDMPDLDFGIGIISPDDLSISHSVTSRVISIQDMMSGKIDFNDLVAPFVPGNDLLYISENSDSHYRIYGYDYDGNRKVEIRKAFQNIRYNEEEKAAYIEEMKRMSRGVQDIRVGNFKKAIGSMHTDKYGRLLVIPNVDRNIDEEGVYVDIFKDGKFLNRADYNIRDKENIGLLSLMRGQEFFSGDRMYVLNMEELKIDVYEY